MSRRILNLIDKHDVISFDIFDTLVVRPFMRPTDLFHLIESKYQAVGFAKARMGAERIFYSQNGNQREANVDDIYAAMPGFEYLKDTEIALEIAGLQANPEMWEIYDYARRSGKRIIITSDMYLPADVIKQILQKNGFDGFEKLYLSNTLSLRKDRGDIYPHIIADLNVQPGQILHIGDNARSDYKMAACAGIDAFLYRRPADDYLKRNSQLRCFWNSNVGNTGASVITALTVQHKSAGDYWTDFGYRIAGPVAYAYAQHIYKYAKQHKLKKVLFIARDGWMIEQAFKAIPDNKIETAYVYAPRVLNYTANLDYDSKKPEQSRIICEYFGVDTGTTDWHLYIQQRIDKFTQMAIAEKQRTGYAQYIKSIVGDNKAVGVVDTISGQLSGQKLIEKESGIPTVGFYVLTLPGNPVMQQMTHIDLLTGVQGDFQSLNRPDLIELIFSAPENPILTMRDGAPVYQEVLNPYETTRHDICRKIARGALEFINDVNVRTNNIGIDIGQNLIMSLINSYMLFPKLADIYAMGQVKRSLFADNSVYEPIFADAHTLNPKKISKLIWKTPLQNAIYVLTRPVKIEMRGLKRCKIIFLPNMRPTLNISLFKEYGLFIGKQ